MGFSKYFFSLGTDPMRHVHERALPVQESYKFNFLNDHAPALDFKPFDAVPPVNSPDSSER